MEKFNQEDFNEFILNNKIIYFSEEPITLNSGRKSHVYVNWRKINDVYSLNELADYILAFTKKLHLKPDCFYGVPEGATKIAFMTQIKLAEHSADYSKGSHAIPMGRKIPKEHGLAKDRYFIEEPRGKTIVLEDVTTTGNSLMDELSKLKKLENTEIISTIGITNRMFGDEKKFFEKFAEGIGVGYHYMSNLFELLPLAYEKLKPNEKIARAVEDEFRTEKIKLIK